VPRARCRKHRGEPPPAPTQDDRLDAAKLGRVLMAWYRGERHVCSMVRAPSRDEEDLRRSHRERRRHVAEQIAYVNRIKGLLFAYGIESSAVAAIVWS
jgi:transposase